MNFVYFSPHFPPNFQDFVRALHEQGANVLGIGDLAYDRLEPNLQGWLTQYFRVRDLHDYDELVRACEHFRTRYGSLDGLDSHAEYWLETEARLRSQFGIPGMKPEQLAPAKSKSRMKERYRWAGVPVARGGLVQGWDQALQLASELGYPLVAKPDIGVGAAATYKFEHQGQLEEFLRCGPPTQYFMEEFVQGQLVSFDGLVDRHGELVFGASHVFGRGIMETVNENDHSYYYSERDIPAELEELGRKVIRAFDVRERFFHFEFFKTDRGYLALEVNLRPPGGMTANMFCWANDADVFREWASLVVHDRRVYTYRRPYHVIWVSRRLNRAYRLSHFEVLERCQNLLVHHLEVEPIFRGAIGDYGYILRCDELQPLLDAAHLIHQT